MRRREQRATTTSDQRGGDRRQRGRRSARSQRRRVAPRAPAHDAVLLLLHAPGDEQRDRRGHEGDRQDERAEQREDAP